MPITQSRIIALISTARALQAGLLQAQREAKLHLDMVQQKIMTPEAAVSELVSFINPNFLVSEYSHHLVLLAQEEVHFKHTFKDNLRRAEKMKRRRREGGVMVRKVAPASLISPRKQYVTEEEELPEMDYSLPPPPRPEASEPEGEGEPEDFEFGIEPKGV